MISQFFNKHAGETCVLVGNGRNLHLTPPEWFGYPALGMNTIHLYESAEGWQPDYYVTVDQRVMREFGNDITAKYGHLPKFIPTPNLDAWQGDNFHRFYHRPGAISTKRTETMLTDGIAFSNVMSVAMQIAYYMGFTTVLIIGMEHKPEHGRDHFWGVDVGMPTLPPIDDWYKAYKTLVDGMQGVRVLNISEQTYCPAEIIPRGDWRDWRTHESISI